MKVQDVLDRINFNIYSVEDLQGVAFNPTFSNKDILMQLKFALDKYANVTKAIQSIYSFPLTINTDYVKAPPNILRSHAYKSIFVFVNNYCFEIGYKDMEIIKNMWPIQMPSGPPFYCYQFEDNLYFMPKNSTSAFSSELSVNISATDTIIQVDDVGGYFMYDGLVTIGAETIRFAYKDVTTIPNQLIGCERGLNNTTATSHSAGELIYNNNCHIWYYKKHFEIPLTGTIIDPSYLTKQMEVCDEHLETICDYVAYKLLSKIDANRASFYKVNFDEWLIKAKWDIDRERSAISTASSFRSPYRFEARAGNFTI